MREFFFKPKPYLIIGDHSALYHDGSEEDLIILKTPQCLSKRQNFPPLIDIYMDTSDTPYECLQVPKLSRFELKQALRNHPDLQDKTLIAVSAFLSNTKEVNLWRLLSTPLLRQWLKGLAHYNIIPNTLRSLPFYYMSSLPMVPTKALYWISKTSDQRVRHVCVIKGSIIFVRYTPLNSLIQNTIKETLNFIQRDYALDYDDITSLNHLENPHILPKAKRQREVSLLWLSHLSEDLALTFKALRKKYYYEKGGSLLKKVAVAAFFVSGICFVKSSVSYYHAHSQKKSVNQASRSLPTTLKNLSLEKLEHLAFLIQNAQTPFFIIKTLQKHAPFLLEELHWKTLNTTQQKLNLAIKHQSTLSTKERSRSLKKIFNKIPQSLPFDPYVDRFELLLTDQVGERRRR